MRESPQEKKRNFTSSPSGTLNHTVETVPLTCNLIIKGLKLCMNGKQLMVRFGPLLNKRSHVAFALGSQVMKKIFMLKLSKHEIIMLIRVE